MQTLRGEIMKQCGNCEFWDIDNLWIIKDSKISDCKSNDIRSESFIEVEDERDTFSRYPMLENEGFECPVHKERITLYEEPLDTSTLAYAYPPR